VVIATDSEAMYFFFKGRVALYAILKAIGVKQGHEIIIPGFTCIVVPNAIIYLGAKPVYVDIDPWTFNIDVSKLEEKLLSSYSSLITQPKAIIVQHTFGIPAEMDKIIEIAKKYNLYVIEDSCHAIGSKYKGKEVGTFGDAAFFSSQWSKPVTTGLGGWALVNNPDLNKKIDIIYQEFLQPSFKESFLLRLQYLIYLKLYKPSLFYFVQNAYRAFSRLGIAIGSSSNEELECKMPQRYLKKMSAWQIALLDKKLEEIDKYIEHRKLVKSFYERLLKKHIKTVKLANYYEPVFLRYPVLVENKRKVLQEAKKLRIELGDWFLSPIHPNLEGWEKVGYKRGMCPVAEKICEHVINLPTHRGITEKNVEKIVKFIADSSDKTGDG
jgi:dTDP-4-amino-4,6-dideoxygalactose transaminase